MDNSDEATIECIKAAVAIYAGNIMGVTINTVFTTKCVYEAGLTPTPDVR